MDRSRADRVLADWDRISRQTSRPHLAPRKAVATALPVSTISAAVLLIVVVAGASLWLSLPPRVGEPGGQASPSLATSPSPEPSDSVGPSPSVEPSPSLVGTWGPLAVIPPQDGTDLARTEGTLRITDACVVLESQGKVTLLFWPADRTTWDGGSRAITFENYDGSVVTVSDGDHVVLGGGGDSEAESGISGQDWVRGMVWVAKPASSCPLDVRFGVGAVEK